MIDYPFKFEKTLGRFIERPNRFVVKVEIDGRLSYAYLPNPGRLWELLIPYETELMLLSNKDSTNLPYTVLACKGTDHWILLHTHLTNRIVKSLIVDSMLPFYRGFKFIGEEIKWGKSRFDLLIEREESILVEVKTCTLFSEKLAMFPDAPTERGVRHLRELDDLSKKGIKTAILFVIMNPEVEFFLPAYHIDFKFAEAFNEVKDNVEIRAINLKMDDTFTYVERTKEVVVPFPFLDKVLKDRGCYLLLMYLEKTRPIKIGLKGEILFPSGFYVYVGSAKVGLQKRIARHRRRLKKLHWHIDYLTREVRS
ncbi:MAG: DNA/RNA nuclease SfsA, partial [Thermodesulfovibrionales bacterium]